jgi:hypothetical protein
MASATEKKTTTKRKAAAAKGGKAAAAANKAKGEAAKAPKAKAAPKSRRASEADLIAKYPHIVEGSLRYETEGTHAKKQTVEINTRGSDGEPDGNTRRIATSDLHQVFHTEEVAEEVKKIKRREANGRRRAAIKAAKEAEAAEAAEAEDGEVAESAA